jgi:hypothetical protein
MDFERDDGPNFANEHPDDYTGSRENGEYLPGDIDSESGTIPAIDPKFSDEDDLDDDYEEDEDGVEDKEEMESDFAVDHYGFEDEHEKEPSDTYGLDDEYDDEGI